MTCLNSPARSCRRLFAVWACLLGLFAVPAWSQAIRVAAASDLKFALEEIAARYKADTGHVVALTLGSSGTFATQIRNGAPFQLFLSADEDFVSRLHADGFAKDEGVLYAIGRLALMAPKGSPLQVDAELKGLEAALKAGHITRFAIANPEHAPYGRRAEEALRHAQLWELVKPRLVLGENISQAAQFTTSGSAQGGIIALSLASAPQLADLGRFAVIPASWHAPLRQRMVRLKAADAATDDFYRYLQQPAARTIMQRHGFTLPAEGE